MIALVLPGCQQEQETDLNNTLDLKISVNANKIMINADNYLDLSVENISSKPVKMPDGLLVLEFTSYSGSIREAIALTPEMLEAQPEWEEYRDYILEANEKIDLHIDLGNILFGGEGIDPLHLPTDSYAINAYYTPGNVVDVSLNSGKVRSNYLYVDIISNHDELSYKQHTD